MQLHGPMRQAVLESGAEMDGNDEAMARAQEGKEN